MQITNTGSNASDRLSSGLRINGASDDAAGLAISEKMRGQATGLETASKNALDSVSLVQTADGALGETHSILQRMRELAVQSSNGIYTDSDRAALNGEMKQLQSELTRIGNTTEFNTQKLLDGSAGGFTSQIGANSGQTATLSISDMRARAIGVDGLDISTAGGAADALDALDFAIQSVSHQRGNLGANQNRLEHTINNLNTSAVNTRAAESRIRDTDMARETINLTRDNILRQTSLAMVAQGNMQRQSVLQLLA